jgi:hypothetical protein
MLFTITNEQKIKVSINPQTLQGNPAPVDGAPVWTVTSGDATIEPSEDGLSCYLISGAANVNSAITVTADADMGEGFIPLVDTADLAVVSAQASSLGMTAGEAELK